ncbi:AAEL008359-PA [Aedes aegypti]|uniref:AAEL008359-PA n=1 Tax=Aedes aegypti TaxID=7159 RepID=Q0IEQ1_AEDAE|nr:AAEL008359-PA [Aedes aegypti]
MKFSKKVTFVVLVSIVACIESAVINEYKDHSLETNLASDSLNNSNDLRETFRPSTAAPKSISSSQAEQGLEHPKRAKRAIIFRPLFVYRQQQIKKQRLREMRQQQRQHQMDSNAQRLATQKPKYAYRYPYYYNYMG